MQLGPNVGNAVISKNAFREVDRPTWLAKADNVLVLPDGAAGELLFGSGDLTGWVEEQHDFFKKKNPNAATWSLKDGIVSCDGSLGNCGFLRYDKRLSDFTLRLEYRMSKIATAASACACLNPMTAPSRPFPPGAVTRFRFSTTQAWPEPMVERRSLRALPPKVNAAKPAGVWNELEVICRGPKLRVTLNGQVVQDVGPNFDAGDRRPASRRYLSLQNHGHKVEFRNVRLKDEAGTK